MTTVEKGSPCAMSCNFVFDLPGLRATDVKLAGGQPHLCIVHADKMKNGCAVKLPVLTCRTVLDRRCRLAGVGKLS